MESISMAHSGRRASVCELAQVSPRCTAAVSLVQTEMVSDHHEVILPSFKTENTSRIRPNTQLFFLTKSADCAVVWRSIQLKSAFY